MFDIFRRNIEVLKKRVQFNLEIISKNENRIKELLKEPVSKERAKKLKEQFEFNKNLLDENRDALIIQKSLIDFMEKHKLEMDDPPYLITNNEDASVGVDVDIEKEDYFDLTINGALDFDKKHPYYHDEIFIQDLIQYFTEVENYEMCSRLMSCVKRKLSRSVN
jgi:Rad3-related DNA helicase